MISPLIASHYAFYAAMIRRYFAELYFATPAAAADVLIAD